MRGPAPLVMPAPLERMLPGMLQDDDFACRLMASFDEVVAPLFSTIDNLGAYLDPDTTPADFLDWLASWFGLILDHSWPLEKRRRVVGEAADIYRWRGTASGVKAVVALYCGAEPEILEPGAAEWSDTPGTELPGRAGTSFTVRVTVDDPSQVEADRLDQLVRAAKPAHLEHVLEIIASDG